MTITRIFTVSVLLVAVSSPVHNTQVWNHAKVAPPPIFIKPLLLPVSNGHSAALSPELLNLLQNHQPDPTLSSFPPPNGDGLTTTPANPLSIFSPSLLNQFSAAFNDPPQISAARAPRPQNGNTVPIASNGRPFGVSSTVIPDSDRPSSDSFNERDDKDSYPPENFPAPPVPQTYPPIRTGSATTAVQPPPSPGPASTPTFPPKSAEPLVHSTLLPIQPLNLSPNLNQELIKFLSAVNLPAATPSSQEPVKNENSNVLVEPSSDDLPSGNPPPLSPGLSTLAVPTVSKQSPAPAPDRPENPLLNLLLNSQAPINLLSSFISLPGPNTPTVTTTQPPTIKRSLNPSFIKYLSTLPRYQQTSN